MPILHYEDEGQGSSFGLSRLPDVVRATGVPRGRESSGGPSVLGTLARGLVAPLTAIDTPRRAIISGIREVTDLLDRDPETQGSFRDFLEQTKDPSYGVGSAFQDPTGNKWVDRAIGFVGDVALDPVTYLTLGAGKAATLGGRAALATDLLLAAKAVDRVDEARPLIQKVTQRGVGGLKGADRDLFDEIIRTGRVGTGGGGAELGQAGLRFRLPFTGRETAPIPGTQGIAEGIGGALSSARLRAGQSATGQRLRQATAPRERVGLYDQMVMGGDPETLVQRLLDTSAGDIGTAARNIAARRLGQVVDEVAVSGRKEGVSGEELTRQLASGAPTSESAVAARGFLNSGVAELSSAGSTIQYRQNYVPRMTTDEGAKIMRGDLGDEIRQTVGVFDDLSQEGITMTRGINAGDTLTRNGRSVVLEGDDPFAMNKAMNELFPELGGSVKFVEEDGYKLLERWARSASAELGRLRYADETVRSGLGAERGQVTRAAGITGDISEGAVESVPQRVDDLRAARQQALDESRVATSEARLGETARIQSEAARAEGAANQAQQRADAAWRRAQKRLQQIDDEVVKIDKQIEGLRGKQANVARRQLRDRSNRRARLLSERSQIELQLPELRSRRDAAQAALRAADEAAAAGATGPAIARPTGAAIGGAQRAEQRVADISSELSALGRGAEGIVSDPQIEEEIGYLLAKRGEARVASDMTKGATERIPYSSYRTELVPVQRLEKIRSNALRPDIDIDALARDIAQRGQIEPLIVIYGTDSNKVVLAEGHHRLEALSRLGYDSVPVRVLRRKDLGDLEPYARPVPGYKGGRPPEDLLPSEVGMVTARPTMPDDVAAIQARGVQMEQRAGEKLDEAAGLRARDTQVLDANQRTAAAVRRRKKAQAAEARASRQVNAAAKDGFAPSLDGENAAENIVANLRRVPEEGNKRLRREARALVEDVPEGELLTRDERYLAGLRQAAKNPNDAAAQVAFANMLQAYSIETKIAAEGGKGRTFANFFESLYGKSKNSADFRQNILNELQDGWRMIEGTGVAVPDAVYQMRQRIVELNKPETFDGFLKAWETYTKFFKAYVTATPRFHIRNGMSASFMNWSEGVSAAQMIEGVRIWKKYAKDGIDALDGR